MVDTCMGALSSVGVGAKRVKLIAHGMSRARTVRSTFVRCRPGTQRMVWRRACAD